MKKLLRIVTFLSFAALYGFAMSLYSSSQLFENTDILKQTNSSSQQYFFASSNIPNQIGEKESSVSVCGSIPITTINNPFNKLSASANAIEQSFFSTYTQYSFYSQYLLIRLLKTDIIFPFHYFW